MFRLQILVSWKVCSVLSWFLAVSQLKHLPALTYSYRFHMKSQKYEQFYQSLKWFFPEKHLFYYKCINLLWLLQACVNKTGLFYKVRYRFCEKKKNAVYEGNAASCLFPVVNECYVSQLIKLNYPHFFHPLFAHMSYFCTYHIANISVNHLLCMLKELETTGLLFNTNTVSRGISTNPLRTNS